MKYDHNDIFTAVSTSSIIKECQFNRKCANSQNLLNRIADDYIFRYSIKNPNPDFFKEDSSLTLNQFTLYSDCNPNIILECVRVMKKFEFLQPGAIIIEAITTSLLKLNNFLSKQLYHILNEAPSIQTKDFLPEKYCLNCIKLKQTQRLKMLKQQLHIKHISLLEYRKMNDMVNRCLEDQNEIIITVNNFQALHQDQIRNRLVKMEFDHDKRKREMTICLEELNRANDKILEYGKIVQKKGGNFSDKFNIKDYIFKLGRHFCHNISSLDLKIKQLKNSLLPTIDSESQTQKQYIQLSIHYSKLSHLSADLSQSKNLLSISNNNLFLQQLKSKQLQQRLQIIQSKFFDNQSKRQEQLIQNKIIIQNYKKKLNNSQQQIIQLKNKLRNIKLYKNAIIGQQKKEGKKSILTRQFLDFVETIINDQSRTQSSSGTSKDFKEQFIQKQYPASAQLVLQNSQFNNSIKHYQAQMNQLQLQPKLKKMRFLIKQQKDKTNFPILYPISNNPDENIKININKPLIQTKINHFQILVTVNQYYTPSSIKNISERFSLYLDKPQKLLLQSSIKQLQDEKSMILKTQKRKLSKLDINRLDVNRLEVGKITAKKRQPHTIAQLDLRFDLPQKQQKKQSYIQKNINQLYKMNKKKDKINFNTVYTLHPDKTKLKILQGIQAGNIKKNGKKRRNFSQQNSIQKQYNEQIKKCAPRQIKQKLLGEKQRKLLYFDDQQGCKILRNSITRTQCPRIVLSLQEINYSTYLFSIIAKLHVRNFILYENVRKFIINLFPNSGDSQSSFKQSVNYLLLMHRKCKSGMICYHLQMFLDKIKNI